MEIELGCIWTIWTILLDIINYTKEWENILDVLLVYVTMTCNTQCCIKKYSIVNEYIIMHKLPKDGAIREARICAIFKGRKQVVQESIYIFVTASLPG